MHIADVIPDDECDGEDGSDEARYKYYLSLIFSFSSVHAIGRRLEENGNYFVKKSSRTHPALGPIWI